MILYLSLFFGQAFNFLLIVLNIRACAKGYILAAIMTDFVICLLGFKLTHLIVEAQTLRQMLAYAAGGSTGSWLAITVSRGWDTT